MKRTIWIAVAALAALCGCQQSNQRLAGYATFGAPPDTRASMPLARAVSAIDQYDGQAVSVTARIADVCQKRGCWMMLEDGGQRVRVRFTKSEQCTDGFLVPLNAVGHEAVVDGVISRDTIPEDWARHYAEDEGKSAEEIAKIVGPQPVVVMVATGVMISNGDQLDPPVQ